jgi:hypothetical protein
MIEQTAVDGRTSEGGVRRNGVHPTLLAVTAPFVAEPTHRHVALTPGGPHPPTPVAPRHPDTPTRGAAPKPTPTAVAKAVAPLIVVNALAVYGQLAYAYDHIAPTGWPTPARVALSIGFATAVESVALYVGWHAHDALLLGAHGTARRLRRWSFAIAAAVGAMNYAHFTGARLTPTAAACAFGLLSLLSPWMWGLHTRRQQHIQLLKERRVDGAGAEFSAERRRNFPIRTWRARRWSIDHNVSDPVAAWEGFKRSAVIDVTPDRVVDTPEEPTAVAPTCVAPTWPVSPSGRHPLPVVPLSPPTVDTPEPVAPDVNTDRVRTPRKPTPRHRRRGATPPPVGHSREAATNAAELRRRYPDGLPSNYKIRTDTGWSDGRVKNARAAYDATPNGAQQ